MIIKLTPPQVSEYWEIIKYSLVKGDLVGDDHRQVVLNETLQALLSEKAQCFLRFNSETRKVMAVMITRIKISDRIQEKFLYIQCIFSYQAVKNPEWQEDWNFVSAFARDEDCKYILADSENPKIHQIMGDLGAQEIFRTFQYSL